MNYSSSIETAKDLILLLDLNETMDYLVMLSSVCCYCFVMKREEHGHVLKRSLDFICDDHREKGRLKRTWKKQVGIESMKFGLCWDDALC